MPETKEDPIRGINSWLEDELAYQYKFDRQSIDAGWSAVFAAARPNGGDAAALSAEPVPFAAAVVAELPRETAATSMLPNPTQASASTAPRLEPTAARPPASSAALAPLPSSLATADAAANSTAAGHGDQLIPLRGAAARIAENMTASLLIPVATSQRQIPVR